MFAKSTYELYSEVAGGFFTTKYNPQTEGVEDGSRFDPNKAQGQVKILLVPESGFILIRVILQSYRRR